MKINKGPFDMKARALFCGFSGMLCLLVAAASSAQETSVPAPAGAPPDKSNQTTEVTYPSDEDRMDGDHLKLRVNVVGFKPIDGPDKGKEKCAPKGTTIIVNKHKGHEILARVELGKIVKAAKAGDPKAKEKLDKPG